MEQQGGTGTQVCMTHARGTELISTCKTKHKATEAMATTAMACCNNTLWLVICKYWLDSKTVVIGRRCARHPAGPPMGLRPPTSTHGTQQQRRQSETVQRSAEPDQGTAAAVSKHVKCIWYVYWFIDCPRVCRRCFFLAKMVVTVKKWLMSIHAVRRSCGILWSDYYYVYILCTIVKSWNIAALAVDLMMFHELVYMHNMDRLSTIGLSLCRWGSGGKIRNRALVAGMLACFFLSCLSEDKHVVHCCPWVL